jgi:hypothetical protein
MFFGVLLWSERSLVEGIDYVADIQPVLARYCLDAAIIARTA